VSRSDEHRIADILSAAGELGAIVERGRAAFTTDPILSRATERLLEIIGEAANQLEAGTTDCYPDIPWRDISRLRIVLAHHYHRVDPDQVWVIATTHIPELVAALRRSGG
jgi:uncharacterized protein with HEPN domain